MRGARIGFAGESEEQTAEEGAGDDGGAGGDSHALEEVLGDPHRQRLAVHITNR